MSAPAHQRPVFILSSGRSGSTLVQRALNASPELTIWGEHGGFLGGLAESYYQFHASDEVGRLFRNSDEDIRSMIGEVGPGTGVPYWHNCITGASFRNATREMLVSLFSRGLPDGVRPGFKEVRYGDDDRTIAMLDGLFPNGQFIFLARSPSSYARSALLAWEPDVVASGEDGEVEHRYNLQLRRWRQTNVELLKAAKMIGVQRAKVVTYEALVRESEKGFAEVFEFLGVPPPALLGDVLAERSNATAHEAGRARIEELGLREDEVCAELWAEWEKLGTDGLGAVVPPLISGSERLGGGLFESPWLGTFELGEKGGFIRSTLLGWCRPVMAKGDPSKVWLWREGAGWFFTGERAFPAMFSDALGEWVKFEPRSGADGEYVLGDGRRVAADGLLEVAGKVGEEAGAPPIGEPNDGME